MKTVISTTDYDIEKWEDYNDDDEGRFIYYKNIEYNFDDCDFQKEHSNQHLTP